MIVNFVYITSLFCPRSLVSVACFPGHSVQSTPIRTLDRNNRFVGFLLKGWKESKSCDLVWMLFCQFGKRFCFRVFFAQPVLNFPMHFCSIGEKMRLAFLLHCTFLGLGIAVNAQGNRVNVSKKRKLGRAVAITHQFIVTSMKYQPSGNGSLLFRYSN